MLLLLGGGGGMGRLVGMVAPGHDTCVMVLMVVSPRGASTRFQRQALLTLMSRRGWRIVTAALSG